MNISFELYKIFYHTATQESFSAAARQLFITQSAVSQGIKNLEQQLGVQLFFRKGRGCQLTQEGKLLLSHIGQAYNFIKTAELKMSELQNLDSGEIRIGASDTVCKYFLLPQLQQFNHNYPKIRIQVINRTSKQILQMLQGGSIDFGIITLPSEQKKIACRELIKVEDIWVAAPQFEPLTHKPLCFSQLLQQPLLLLENTSTTRRQLNSYLDKLELKLTPRIELESVDLLVEFAKIGLGIAHVLRESAQSSLKTGELIEIKTEQKLPLRQLAIVTIENVPLSHAAEEFVKTLETEVKKCF